MNINTFNIDLLTYLINHTTHIHAFIFALYIQIPTTTVHLHIHTAFLQSLPVNYEILQIPQNKSKQVTVVHPFHGATVNSVRKWRFTSQKKNPLGLPSIRQVVCLCPDHFCMYESSSQLYFLASEVLLERPACLRAEMHLLSTADQPCISSVQPHLYGRAGSAVVYSTSDGSNGTMGGEDK